MQQTHGSRGPKDTALLEMVNNRQLILYDAPELRQMTAGADAKELGNGLVFLKKASGRAKIDLLVALSNCADEAAYYQPAVVVSQVVPASRLLEGHPLKAYYGKGFL